MEPAMQRVTESNGSKFFVALSQELMAGMNCWHGAENWDEERFGPYRKSFKSAVLDRVNKILSERFVFIPVRATVPEIQKIDRLKDSVSGLNWFYERLSDQASKDMLVKVLSYRLLGPKRIKLPVNDQDYWPTRRGLNSLIKGSDTIKVKFHDLELKRFDLAKLGYPIELFFTASGLMATFALQQYRYRHSEPEIGARPGDYVIDAGSCWGDTALYFAHQAGPDGHVYSFEFEPDNLKVFEKNLELNPELAPRIEIVREALWRQSGETLHCLANGPASSLVADEANHGQDAVPITTASIDDFVARRKLPRVDFIKMDIEGAELDALHGARQTIEKFKPRLAISIYHRDSDFIDIPAYLNQLHAGYDFFLDHFTIYGEETILFAQAKDARQ